MPGLQEGNGNAEEIIYLTNAEPSKHLEDGAEKVNPICPPFDLTMRSRSPRLKCRKAAKTLPTELGDRSTRDSRLLELPVECRLNIYEHFVQIAISRANGAAERAVRSANLSITLVNRQIHREFKDLLWSRLTLSLFVTEHSNITPGDFPSFVCNGHPIGFMHLSKFMANLIISNICIRINLAGQHETREPPWLVADQYQEYYHDRINLSLLKSGLSAQWYPATKPGFPLTSPPSHRWDESNRHHINPMNEPLGGGGTTLFADDGGSHAPMVYNRVASLVAVLRNARRIQNLNIGVTCSSLPADEVVGRVRKILPLFEGLEDRNADDSNGGAKKKNTTSRVGRVEIMPFWPMGYWTRTPNAEALKRSITTQKRRIGDQTEVRGFMHTGLSNEDMIFEYADPSGNGGGGGGKYWKYPYVWRAKTREGRYHEE